MKKELKTALRGVNREIKDFTTVANDRTRALEGILRELTREGTKGVEKALSRYGKHLTPAETELIRAMTAEQIDTLVEIQVQLKKFLGKGHVFLI